MNPIAKALRTARNHGINHLVGLQSLLLIGQQGRISVGAISDHCGVSRTSATGNADILERLHLIRRQHDPEDRRKVWVELTDKGRHLINELASAHS